MGGTIYVLRYVLRNVRRCRTASVVDRCNPDPMLLSPSLVRAVLERIRAQIFVSHFCDSRGLFSRKFGFGFPEFRNAWNRLGVVNV